MLYDFYPWKIDVDKADTEKFYTEKDFSLNKEWNQEFEKLIGDSGREFFVKLGVDLLKTEVEEKVLEFHEDDEEQQILTIACNFAIKGRFAEIPSWQAEIYEDDEIMGKMPEVIKRTECEEMACPLGNSGYGVVFKPPYFKVEKGNLRVWDSGYVVGSVLITEE